MVAVRSAHLNTEGDFALDQWIASLGIANPQSCQRVAETWRYCEAQTQGHPDQSLLLWRGIEMWRSSPCSAWILKACVRR